jgi:hypothetical protein
MTEDYNVAHCRRVADACGLAIKHASQLLGEPTQAFVDEILTDPGPHRIASCLAQITQRQPATNAETSLLVALKIVVNKLWKYEPAVTRHHFPRVLLICWNSIGEQLDREAFRQGERWDGGNGPRQTGEMAYHDEVITPMIQRSFETLWKEQAKLKMQKAVEVS